MSRRLSGALGIVLALPFSFAVLQADSKDEETLNKANAVLQEMLGKADFAPNLGKAKCILVLPEVKKFGIGIGGSGGRGPMSCRQGRNFEGTWSAPALYSVGGVSAGLQIGGSSTDFVLLVMNQKGVDALLKGKTKLGSDATATAGSSGATASSVGSDILTYGKASGLFAGVSLGNATIEPDANGNKRLYGRQITVSEILAGKAVQSPPAGEPLISSLNTKIPRHTATK